MAALRANCPVTVAGTTVNRFRSSGLQATSFAAQRIFREPVPTQIYPAKRSTTVGLDVHEETIDVVFAQGG